MISRKAAHTPGSATGLLPRGRKVPLEPLLQALIMISANDAAVALAEHDGGTRASVRQGDERAGAVDGPHLHPLLHPERAARPRQLLVPARPGRAGAGGSGEPARSPGSRRRAYAKPRFPIKGKHLYLYNNHYFLQHGLTGIPQAQVTGLKTGFTDAGGSLLRHHGAPGRPPARGRAAPLAQPAHPGAGAAARGVRGGRGDARRRPRPSKRGRAAARPARRLRCRSSPPASEGRASPLAITRSPAWLSALASWLARDLAHTESRLPDFRRPCLPAEAGELLQRRAQRAGWRGTGPRTRSSASTTRAPGSTRSRSWRSSRSRPPGACARAPRTRVAPGLHQPGRDRGLARDRGDRAAAAATDGDSLEPPPGPVLMLPSSCWSPRRAGTLIGRSEGWAEQGQTEASGRGDPARQARDPRRHRRAGEALADGGAGAVAVHRGARA